MNLVSILLDIVIIHCVAVVVMLVTGFPADSKREVA